MKAKLLAIIVVAVAIVPFGLPSSGQLWPSRSPMISACQEANSLIPELIELAPYGTGWVNRTKAWIEKLLGVIGDILSWIFNTQQRSELSQVARAVIAVNIKHTSLYFDLRTIMKAPGKVVEEFLPSKLLPPVTFIHRLKFLKESIVDRECKRFLGKAIKRPSLAISGNVGRGTQTPPETRHAG